MLTHPTARPNPRIKSGTETKPKPNPTLNPKWTGKKPNPIPAPN